MQSSLHFHFWTISFWKLRGLSEPFHACIAHYVFYVKGHSVAGPPWSECSLQHCWSSSLTGCCWRTPSSSSPDRHVTRPDEEGGREGRMGEIKRKGVIKRKFSLERETAMPLKTILCLCTTNPCWMDLRGLKTISAYITIHKHRLFVLPHQASSSQSVIVFPDAKSLCLPLPFTITPLIIPDETEAAGRRILILPLHDDTGRPDQFIWAHHHSSSIWFIDRSDVSPTEILILTDKSIYVGELIQLWICYSPDRIKSKSSLRLI